MPEIRLVGKWWVADDHPDDREMVGGTLTVEEVGRVSLELTDELFGGGLFSEFEGGRKIRRRSADEETLIHGAADGQMITLVNCTIDNGGSTSLLPIHTATQVLRADAALVGCWLGNADEAAFIGMQSEISHLTQWTGASGISYDVTTVAVGTPAPFHTVYVEGVPTVEAALSEDGVTARLIWNQRFGPGGNENAWDRQHRVSERAILEVRSDTARDLFGFGPTVRAVQNLLTAASQSACAVRARRLIAPPPADDPDGIEQFVDLYFHSEEIKIKESLSAHRFVFTLPDIEPFDAALQRWVSLVRQVGASIDVLFGLDYNTGGYYEHQLFQVASAAEGIHAALRPDSTAVDDETYKAIKAVVRTVRRDAGINEAGRKFLHDAIPNRPGLQQRFLELTGMADAEAVSELLTNVGVWAQWLANARNAIGHGHQMGARAHATPDHAHYQLVPITKHLLHLVLLAELGVSSEVQRRAVKQLWGGQAEQFGRFMPIASGSTAPAALPAPVDTDSRRGED